MKQKPFRLDQGTLDLLKEMTGEKTENKAVKRAIDFFIGHNKQHILRKTQEK